MVNRFPNMISIIHQTIKTGNTSCEVPINKLCLQTLKFFREQNLIYGFQYVSPGKKTRKLYPRVRIYVKYSDINGPIITYIRVLKNTFSNFKLVSLNYPKQENNHKKIMISTPKGLTLISSSEIHSGNIKIKGKQLLEISF